LPDKELGDSSGRGSVAVADADDIVKANQDLFESILALGKEKASEPSVLNDWEEHEHPRRKDGKFGTGGGDDDSPSQPVTFEEPSDEEWQEMNTLHDDLAEDVRQSIRNYSLTRFAPINSYLRTGDGGDEDTLADVRNLDSAMTPLSKNMLVRRAVSRNAFPSDWSMDPEDVVGTTIADKGFLSTTAGRANNRDVVMEIEVPEGHPHLVPGRIARYDEKEIILGRGTSMIVTSAYTADTLTGPTLHLRTRVVTDEAASS
jgi:hypothetical protein